MPRPLSNFVLPGVVPVSPPVLAPQAAQDLATAANVQEFLYSGNTKEIYQRWNQDREFAMRAPAEFLARQSRVAQQEDYAAADAVISRMNQRELASAGPLIRDAYAEINARSRGALAGFREIAIKAGLTSPEYSLAQQDEAAVRLMGQTIMADLWEKTSKADAALDAAASMVTADPNASFFGLIDPETPESFDSELIQRIRRLPAHQQIAAIAAWQDTLIDAHGNFLEFSIQGLFGDLMEGTGAKADKAAKTNVLHVLSNMSAFFEGTTPETNKIIGYLNNLLVGVDAIQGVRAAVRLAGMGGRFGAGVRDSARRAADRASQVRTSITPDAPRTTAGNASRTAQEAQEGASAEGVGRGVAGQPAQAPVASQVAAGENPEVTLDSPAGPFTQQDYRNFGTGGDVRQGARDRTAVRTGEVQEGARVTRRALQQAAVTEADNALADASRRASIPREGEPVISSGRQLDLDLYPSSRVEPTISPRDPNTPVVTYRNIQEILDEPVIGAAPEGPVAPVRAGEPFVSQVSDALPGPDENEVITGQLGALTLKVPAVAAATNTNLAQVVAHVLPGGEELYQVSPKVGEVLTDSIHAGANAEYRTLREALFDALRSAYSGEQGTLATPKEVKRALSRDRRDLQRKIKREIQARIGTDANVSVRRTALRQLGDHTYEVRYKVTDMTGVDNKPLGEVTRVVVLGAEDIRSAGQLPDSVLRADFGVASPKFKFMFNPGRTVDFLVENGEIMLHQAEKYKTIFDSAIREVYRDLSKGERKKVQVAILRSVQLGDGKYIRVSTPDLTTGQFRLDNGQVLRLSDKEAKAYQKFIDLTEVNAYVLNAMRTTELRSKKVKVFKHPAHGDMYAREVGDGYVDKIERGDPNEHPAILNLAGAARKDGVVKKQYSWSEFKDNFYDNTPDKVGRSPYIAAKLEYPLQTSAEDVYDLVIIKSEDLGDIPNEVPWHPMTWIPDVPLGVRWNVVRKTKGRYNGLDGKVIKTRVIARAASKEAADLFSSNVTRFGNEEVTVVPDNVSRWKGDVSFDPIDVVDDEIINIKNLDIVQQMDPISSVSRSFSVIAKDLPAQAFRRLHKARWAIAAQRAGVIQYGDNFDNIILSNTDLGTQFERTREYTRELLGIQTEQENLWNKAFTYLGTKLIGVAPDGVSRAVFSLADKDPISWAQSLTMHNTLGFGNPAQLITQSANVVVAASLVPKHAVPAVPLGGLLNMQGFAGIMADPKKLAERYEYVARMAKDMGMFPDLRSSRLFFQKFRNSGLLDDMNNTGDLAEIPDTSSMYTLDDLKKISLAPYNVGVRIERTYTYALSFLNYRDVLATRGDTRKITEWTSADWNNVFADQQNLSLNMSRANRAGFQKNWLARLPTQFWQVQSKFMEAALGRSRMVTGEGEQAFSRTKRISKLMATQGLLYGASGVGIPAVGYTVYQLMNGGRTPEEDIEAGKSAIDVEAEMVAYRGGAASYALYGLSGGTEFAIANRMSILNGVAETIEGVVTGDKPLNEFMLGASNTWLSNILGGDFLYPAAMLIREPSDSTGHNFKTAMDVLDFTSTGNSLRTTLGMYYDHEYRTRSGNLLDTGEYNTAELALTAIGFQMQEAQDLPRFSMDKKEIEKDLTERARRISIIINTMAADPKYREGQNPEVFQQKIQEIYAGLPPHLQVEVAAKVGNSLRDPESQYARFVMEQIDIYIEEGSSAGRNMSIKAAADRERAQLEGEDNAQSQTE